MRICIAGSFGNQDIGDDAMLEMHMNNLDDLGVDRNDIMLVSNRNYVKGYFGCKNWSKRTDGLQENHDCLIVTGGGTINTRNKRGHSLNRMRSLTKPFADKGKPIFLSGQTIGPLGIDRAHDEVACRIVESVDVLTVRDHERSKKYLDLIGAKPKELIETIDDATDLPYVDSPLPEQFIKIRNEHELLAAMNITSYTSNTKEKRATIVYIVQSLIKQGYHILLVPHDPGDYTSFAKHITTVVPKNNITLLDSRWKTSRMRSGTLKRIISMCDVAIGGRYHFIVFALSTGVPCVGMAGNEYSFHKQMGFAEQVGWDDCITTTNDPQYIIELLDGCKNKRLSPMPKSVSFDRIKTWLKEI